MSQIAKHQGWTLVTGAAGGVGKEICLKLARQGYPLVIHYQKNGQAAAELVELCQSLNVPAERIQGDFETLASTRSFVEEYVSRFPKTQHLINNASQHFLGPLTHTPDEAWVQIFQVNLHAPFLIIKALLEEIKASEGSILNLGYAGIHHIQADLHATAYATTKTSLWMLTRSLAKELRPFGVRVNMISPGYLENSDDIPSKMDNLLSQRLGTLEEVAEMAAYLLSPKCAYVTGQNIEVAGGARLL